MKKIYILLLVSILSFSGIYSQTITIGSISPTTYCAGATINIPFTITGSFNTGNTFTAQLSDASGSFGGSPTSIGTLSSQSTGTINGVIPSTSIGGTNYKIRIKSSSPSDTISPSVTIAINQKPIASFITNPSMQSICFGDSITFTNSINLQPSGQTAKWYFPGATDISSNSWTPNFPRVWHSTGNTTLIAPCSLIVTITNTGCSDTIIKNFTINPYPSINSPSTGQVCSGVVQNYNITSNVFGTTFNWSRAFVLGISNNAVTNQTSNTITEALINTTSNSIVVDYLITPKIGNCQGTQFIYKVTVNPSVFPQFVLP